MTAGRTNSDQLSRNWCTPRKYVAAVTEVFGGKIDLDPCSNEFSIVDARVKYLLPRHDGLTESWDYKRIYVNPPYGSDQSRGTRIADWLARCQEAYSSFDSDVLALVPVAVNTGHWKKFIWGQADAICFFADTRLKFIIDGEEDTKGAPMACCMVYWGKHRENFERIFSKHGAIVVLESQKAAGAAWLADHPEKPKAP